MIHEIEQRTQEWHDIRRGKVTASNASILMAKRGLGLTADKYAKKLVSDSLQQIFEEQFVSFAMQQGIELEPMAIDRYEQETLQAVTSIGFVEHSNDLGASPDGFVGSDGIIEVKCPQAEKHTDNLLADTCPDDYYDQVQCLLYVTGRKWCDLVSFNPHFKLEYQLKVIRVEPDMEWQKLFESRLNEFREVVKNYKLKLNIK